MNGDGEIGAGEMAAYGECQYSEYTKQSIEDD